MTTPVESPSAPAKKRISGAWYALVALPGLLAIATIATHVPKLVAGFSALHVSALAAGSHDIELEAGENTIYVEGEQRHEDLHAKAEIECTIRDDRGTALVLEPLQGHSTFSSPSFSGVGRYDVQIPAAGTYNVTCQTGDNALFAIGLAFPFLSVVWILLALFLALPLTGVTGYIVHRIRNGKRKTARIT